MFETETMAELCLKQGLLRDALVIYRRLLAAAVDERHARAARAAHRRARAPRQRAARGAGRRRRPTSARAPRVATPRMSDIRQVTFDWQLARRTPVPALQILVLRREETGISAERRTVRLPDAEGTPATAHRARPLAARRRRPPRRRPLRPARPPRPGSNRPTLTNARKPRCEVVSSRDVHRESSPRSSPRFATTPSTKTALRALVERADRERHRRAGPGRDHRRVADADASRSTSASSSIVVEAARKRVPVIAGTGSNSTARGDRAVAGRAQGWAPTAAAGHALLQPPDAGRPLPPLQGHRRGGAAADVLYNVPGRTGCDLLPDTHRAPVRAAAGRGRQGGAPARRCARRRSWRASAIG